MKLAGAHAEEVVVEGAWWRGLTPTRGVTTRDICEQICQRDLTEGNWAGGIIFDIVGPREFIAR